VWLKDNRSNVDHPWNRIAGPSRIDLAIDPVIGQVRFCAASSVLISPEVRLRLFGFKEENEIPKEKT
jgi:hypothetical protein